MSYENTVDVLIIGGGPAGVMSAFNLTQAGLSVRIVDRESKYRVTGRSNGIHPRTIEILHSLGLGDKVMADASRIYMFTSYKGTEDGKLVRVCQQNPHVKVVSPYKYQLSKNQAHLESIFREAMQSGDNLLRGFTVTPDAEAPLAKKATVELNVHPVKLTLSDDPETLADPHAYAVTVILEDAQGKTNTVKAKYVLGCDGAHSWTREQLGITMTGTTSDEVWGMVDCELDTDFPDIRTLCGIHGNGRHCAIIPQTRNIVRITVQIDRSQVQIDPNTGRIDRHKIQPSDIQRLAKRALAPYRLEFLSAPNYWGVYVLGQRLASTYQDRTGRVFIVGDACHTHSPHAGQGMNAALGDSYNLSWKLVHVLRGWADKSLLDTYELERRRFAQDLMHLDEKLAEITSGKVKGSIIDVRVQFGPLVAGTGVKYGESRIISPMNQELAKGLVIGVRFPHQTVLRSADCWPVSTHDLLRSDYKYKMIIFTGDPTQYERTQLLERFSESLSDWMDVWPRRAMIQVYTIMHSTKDKAGHTTIPAGLRTAWDTVFTDDVALSDRDGGGDAYERFGIGERGCMVLVRPDGHIAGIMPLGGVKELDQLVDRINKSV